MNKFWSVISKSHTNFYSDKYVISQRCKSCIISFCYNSFVN